MNPEFFHMNEQRVQQFLTEAQHFRRVKECRAQQANERREAGARPRPLAWLGRWLRLG